MVDVKEIAELAKKFGNTELYAKVLELRLFINEINEDKLALQLKVKELEEKIQSKEKMMFKEPFWYREGDETPHCSACFEKNNQCVHLVALDHSLDGRFHCPVCKFIYYGKAKSHVNSYRSSSRGTTWS